MSRNLPNLLPKRKSPESTEDSDDLAESSSEEEQHSLLQQRDKKQACSVDTELLSFAWNENGNFENLGLEYLGPEVLLGGSRKNCLKSDIWSLGCIMAELLMRTAEWQSGTKSKTQDGEGSVSNNTGQGDPEVKMSEKMDNDTS